MIINSFPNNTLAHINVMTHIKSLFLIYFCFAALGLQSQTLDLMTNSSYEFSNYTYELKSEKAYLQDQIEITYSSCKNKMFKKTNEKLLEVCKNYIENEVNYLGLIRDANLRLNVLNELSNSKNYRYSSANYQNPKLKSIETDAISVVGNQVFYELSFSFEANNTSENYDKQTFKVKKYYVANWQTATLKPWKTCINDLNNKKIQEIVAKDFNETYTIVTNKINVKDLTEYEIAKKQDLIKADKSIDVFKKINLADADIYWFNQGIMIQFQEFTKSSVLYGGKFFRLFFPYNQALKIVALVPEFAFLKPYSKITTTVKNFDETSIQKKLSEMSVEPEILNLVAKNTAPKRAKSMQLTMYQISSDNSKRFMSKINYEFNANQKLVSQTTTDEKNKTLNTAFFDYDSQNNLKQKTIKSGNHEQSIMSYDYDDNNNLKSTRTVEDNEINNRYYFYNQNYVYTFSYNFLTDQRSNGLYTSKYELKNNQICLSDGCYILDKNSQICGKISPKTNNYQLQVGRDAAGRIVECHKEDDRYNNYFEYDNQGRITQFESFEYTEKKQNTTFFYTDDATLPNRKLKTSDSGGNKTVIEENYEWQYFD